MGQCPLEYKLIDKPVALHELVIEAARAILERVQRRNGDGFGCGMIGHRKSSLIQVGAGAERSADSALRLTE
jgi:hypothetical protein